MSHPFAIVMVTMTTLCDFDCLISAHLISFSSYLSQEEAKSHFDITVKITKYYSQRDYKNKGPLQFSVSHGLFEN